MANGLHDPGRRLFTRNEPPCPFDWESNPGIDTCAHFWCLGVVVLDWDEIDYAVYCSRCRAPRCPSARDSSPCMERRHHESVHVYLSGEFAPIGGRL